MGTKQKLAKQQNEKTSKNQHQQKKLQKNIIKHK